jgi:hypothetical protein
VGAVGTAIPFSKCVEYAPPAESAELACVAESALLAWAAAGTVPSAASLMIVDVQPNEVSTAARASAQPAYTWQADRVSR